MNTKQDDEQFLRTIEFMPLGDLAEFVERLQDAVEYVTPSRLLVARRVLRRRTQEQVNESIDANGGRC